MDKIASELQVERLAGWGVDTVFGLPGDGINGIMEGFRRHQDRVRFVLVHHEEAAAFMGLRVRQGHGAGRGLETQLLGTGYQQEVHLEKLYQDVAEGFAQAWLRGQPRKATMASTLFRDKLDQLKG